MPHPLVEAQGVRKQYGLQVVLNELDFLVSEKQKIALIGRNGAGKSTLLKILVGDEELDGGKMRFYPQTRLGVVRQHEKLPGDVSTLAYLEQVSGKADWEVKKLGAQFGLQMEHLGKPPANLSGGYQMRVKLVAMLLQDPNLLILDEPVNYLDLQTLLLLERFLQHYKGAFILAAHDRTFLQNTCTHTFEVERGNLARYNGPVEEYLEFKREHLEYAKRNNKKIAREIVHQQQFVDRFRFKASLASRAQSKMKHIAKLRNKITKVEANLATTRITIPSPHVIPGTAIHTNKLAIGYGDTVIASDIQFEIPRGRKVLIAGENGNGKSTFLKTIAGILPPVEGSYKWWHKSDIGYYDQKTDATIDEQETVVQYLTRMAPGESSGERILMMAGNFLFTWNDLDKPSKVLSGGERARLCLAGILLREHNVLILDEPTNHLDVETTDALGLALREYAGTVLIVSHARTFVSTLVDDVYEIRNGTMRRYMGDYDEYVEDLAERMEETLQEELAQKRSTAQTSSAERAEYHAQIRELQRSSDRLQKQLAVFESEKSMILKFFFENPTDYSPEKSQRLHELNEEIERLEKLWILDQERIEAIRTELK